MATYIKTYVERSMIAQDADYIVGLLLSLQKLSGKGDIPFLLSCMDYFSLIVHEAAEYYSRRDATMRSKLQTDYSEIVKQSRQRMKLFDDRVLGIEGIGNMFINIVTPEHQREVSKDHRIPLPKWMWSDIGIYFDEASGLPVGTTHMASFTSGVTNPQGFFSPEVSTGLGRHLGTFLGLFARNIQPVEVGEVSIIAKDMQYNQIYSAKRYGSGDELINASLSVIDMRLNFLGTLLSRGVQAPTVFKWKFLSIFHAISSLKSFYPSDHFTSLDAGHKEVISAVLKSEIASLMLSPEVVPLRNTLTHYGVDTRIDEAKLSRDGDRLFGLVEASLPGWHYQELLGLMNEQLESQLLNLFRAWNNKAQNGDR